MRFDVDVAVTLGDTRVACAFASDAALTVLVGRSGIGKTSLLNMIAGLTRPRRGHVRVDGVTLFDGAVDLPPERRRAGYVFQDSRLFPHLRVRANLLYGARGGAPADFAETIEVLGIGALLDRWPRTLSGGEARRVAIGRALLSGPAFLLLDEPLSSLDPARREEITAVIERMRDSAHMPMLMVTHDEREAGRLGGMVVEMKE